jgi:pimeloyl-ACP methyl ester carboxylesterase
MADDVVALLDTLHIVKADVVGWSDGAILGLDLAIRHPDRVGKVFAFAANTVTSGVQEGVEKNPTFAAFIERAGHEYAKLSATPKDYDAFVAPISKMWEPSRTGLTPNCSRARPPAKPERYWTAGLSMGRLAAVADLVRMKDQARL